MATPTPQTRLLAHAVVGTASTILVNKAFGVRGTIALAAAFLIPAMLHEKFDAPLAQVMANAGF